MSKRSFNQTNESGSKIIDIKTGKNINESGIPVICEKIKYYRESLRMEQKELARALGITANAISNWETGRARPDVYLIPEICRTLHISLYELFDMDDPLNITAGEQLMLRDYRMLTQGHQYSVRRLIESLTNVEISEKSPDLCPILKINRALAAGIGDPSEFEDNSETVYVYYSPEVNRADFIFKVNGDSMEPEYHSGDEVLVQRLSNTCEMGYGDIGAFIIGNEMYIKKYEEDGLHSLNPKYPVMQFEDTESVYLIGKVIGILAPGSYAKEKEIEKYKLMHGEEE